MFLGRFVPMLLVLRLAGLLVEQHPRPATVGTMPTHTPLFVGLLTGCRPHRRRAHLLPGSRPWSHRGGTFVSKHMVTGGHLPGEVLPRRSSSSTPIRSWHSPVIFVVWVGRSLTTVLAVKDPSVFAWSVAGWLWATVLFANAAEAVAEGRGKAQAASLWAAKKETMARRLGKDGAEEQVPGSALRIGDTVVVEAGRPSSPTATASSRASRRRRSGRSPASPRR